MWRNTIVTNIVIRKTSRQQQFYLRKKEGKKERTKQTNNRISSNDKTRFSSASLLLAHFVTAMKSHMHSQCHGTLRVSVHKSYWETPCYILAKRIWQDHYKWSVGKDVEEKLCGHYHHLSGRNWGNTHDLIDRVGTRIQTLTLWNMKHGHRNMVFHNYDSLHTIILYATFITLHLHTALLELWDHDTGECDELSDMYSQSPRLMVMCFSWPLSSSPLCSLALSSKICAVGTTLRRNRAVFILSNSAWGLSSAHCVTVPSASFFFWSFMCILTVYECRRYCRSSMPVWHDRVRRSVCCSEDINPVKWSS